MFYCPQCGEDTPELHEGYCLDCCSENQATLDKHNFEFEQWQLMNEAERNQAIKSAYI